MLTTLYYQLLTSYIALYTKMVYYTVYYKYTSTARYNIHYSHKSAQGNINTL